MKNLLYANISILFVLLFLLSGCSVIQEVSEDSIYNFLNYESEEVFDIEQIDLPYNLSKNCVSYKFTYLSDNLRIKGYVAIPNAAIQSQSPSKCVLYNRGGNSKIGLLDDDDASKLCVETNRIVIASQYRGAGECEGRDEFGGSDINDIVKLIDLCETQFSFIDMEDFCVAGVSRGGMMAYMAARCDERVKRVIAVSAVSDLFKSYEEREDMQKILYSYIGVTPMENPDEYEKRSAVCWSDEITVPVLIIHSKYDEQVSFGQAEDLYEKLNSSNKNVTFVVREDSVHGLSKDDSQEILGFLSQQ